MDFEPVHKLKSLNPEIIYFVNKTHLIVEDVERTTDIILPPGFWMRRDEILPRGEAFLKGIRLYDYPNITAEFFANTSNCFHELTNYTWITIPRYLDYVTLVGPSYWEKWQVTTEAL